MGNSSCCLQPHSRDSTGEQAEVCRISQGYPPLDMKVKPGDLLINLLFPRHIVEYVHNRDKAMLKGRLIRETYRLVQKSVNNGQRGSFREFLVTAGSRATSLRIPIICEYNKAGERVKMHTSDTDLMVVLGSGIIVGDPRCKIHLEFIKDTENPGYGKIVAIKGHEEIPQLFKREDIYGNDSTITELLSGEETLKYLVSSITDFDTPKVLRTYQRKGPALERLNIVATDKAPRLDKADLVMAISSANDYFKEQRVEVMRRSFWPQEIKDAVLLMPILFVQVGPKTCTEPDVTWRVSFSMHEQILSQSISFHQRQVYMIIKYILNYKLSTEEIPEDLAEKELSSYMTMNAFFAFCDENVDENAAKDSRANNMEIVVLYFKYFNKCLCENFLPQYLLPQNNLLKDVTRKWCTFYAAMFDFADESETVELLLNAQQTWRADQFEICVGSHWSGQELTKMEAKSLLLNICLDTVKHLAEVRAVQAIWNCAEMCASLLNTNTHCGQENGQDISESCDESDTETCPHLGPHLSFIGELFDRVTQLVSAPDQMISNQKFINILRLLSKMVPPNCVDPENIISLTQQYLAVEGFDQQLPDTNATPYYIVKFEDRGEAPDHIIETCGNNVTVKLCENGETYVFPYTDHSLLFSEPLNFFLVCIQEFEKLNHGSIQEQLKMFPENIEEISRDAPLVKLICILRKLHFENKLSICDFDKYKMTYSG